MQFPVAAGGTVDCTFRVGLPQLEQLPFATQPIPTSGAAVTRARDEIALPRATAAGEAYSAVVDFCLPNLPPAGAGSEAKLLTTNPTGVVTPLAISPTGSLWSWNGTAGSAGTSNLYTAGTRGKAGFVSYPTGHSRSLNGGSIVWSAGLSFPAGTEMRLAQTGNTDTQCAPTYLHEFRVYSRILTDPELVAATV
jgi:hypothetical protein